MLSPKACETRREDIFVSIGVTGAVLGQKDHAALFALTRSIDRHFRFWELLVVVDVDAVSTADFVAASLPHLRLMKVRTGTSVFQQRVCIAREAIGNVIVMTAIEELDQIIIPEMIDTAETSNSIVMLRRRESNFLNPALVAFGRSAGFRVDLRDMMTAIYPRSLLDRVLRHPAAVLALRFLPVDSSLSVTVVMREAKRLPKPGAIKRISYRLNILRQLLVCSAPRVLSVIELVSVLVLLAAMSYSVYTVVTWLTRDDLQPGWFSTSLVLSMVAMFLSSSIFALAMGLERLLDLAEVDGSDQLVEEINPINVFDSVRQELNIDLDDGPTRASFLPVER